MGCLRDVEKRVVESDFCELNDSNDELSKIYETLVGIEFHGHRYFQLNSISVFFRWPFFELI